MASLRTLDPAEYNRQRIKKLQQNAGVILCACSRCSELIPAITKKGKPAKYKHGHNMVGKPLPYNFRYDKNGYGYSWKGGTRITNGYIEVLCPTHPYKRYGGYVP
jgi:hypothetical protein